MNSSAAPAAFIRHGPSLPEFPVILSVPHGARYYAPALLADAEQPDKLWLLEDRFADRLISRTVERGATVFVAGHARAWIDLNRDPRELDAAMIAGSPPPGLIFSARTRNGLGLIPRHVGHHLNLWKRKFSASEVATRLEECHRPYHDAIADALQAARARFGIAILLDCHSMPPIRHISRGHAPAIVVGDRFGSSASAILGDMIELVAAQEGFAAARNAPYAGGYSLDRHGCPGRGIHAIQIEIDRSLYLDPALHQPGAGLPAAQLLFAKIFAMLCSEFGGFDQAAAAE